MLNPANAWSTIQGFLEAGGPVVVVLLCSTALMWILISERFLFFAFSRPRLRNAQVKRWKALDNHVSWESHMFREQLISEVRVESERFMGVIRALILVTPLLGLLGTVTGMIEVFQVIVDTGASNARLMASGISKATIPTMTGLAVSLTGVFAMSFLDRRNENAVAEISDQLELDAGMGFGTGRRLLSDEADEAEVNITPLLDIVFILLIFFIVTSTFLDEEGLDIATPQESEEEQQTRPPPTMVLSVRNDGFVMVDNVRMIDPRSVKPVIEAFKAENPRGVVLVNAAPDAEIENTVLVVDQSRQAGVDPALAIQGR
ncbi:MAG: biopolymer transporter ExbD [Wenzhouxiangellaceae bacterium]|nr:biopolymer transporter ExbD [Wenzhouxiangellaceae bacterium]